MCTQLDLALTFRSPDGKNDIAAAQELQEQEGGEEEEEKQQ